MDDEYDEFEDDAEVDVKVEFKNEIAEEPLIPPAKHVPLLKELSFGFVALLLVLVVLFNLVIILWVLSR